MSWLLQQHRSHHDWWRRYYLLWRQSCHHMAGLQRLRRVDGRLAKRHAQMRCLRQLVIVRCLEREKGARGDADLLDDRLGE